MNLYRWLKVVALLGVLTSVACEPPEPIQVSSGLTFDSSCDPYLDTLNHAITYVTKHSDRMSYHGKAVADILAGNSVALTIKCVTLGPDDVGSFGQAWRSGDKGYIEINKDKVLKSQWYHPLFAKVGYNGTKIFTAGILAHETTHIWDFFNKTAQGDQCVSTEYEPDVNQYELWAFGHLISTVVACYDSTGRGCAERDNHIEAALLCVFD